VRLTDCQQNNQKEFLTHCYKLRLKLPQMDIISRTEATTEANGKQGPEATMQLWTAISQWLVVDKYSTDTK